jgi:hypothetical protein
MTMRELAQDLIPVEAMLGRAARAVQYPATPALASRVLARIESERPPRTVALPALGVRLAAALAAALLLAAGAALAVPQSRDALADFFGLGHAKIEVGPVLGPAPPVLSPGSFARPSSLAQAERAVDYELRFPVRDGERLLPEQVYMRGGAGSIVVIFVYDDYDLYQTDFGIFGKGVPGGDMVHEVAVGGERAYWIDEGGHIAYHLDAQGRLVIETRRTVERATLLWEEPAGLGFRLETSLPQAEAIALAESLR